MSRQLADTIIYYDARVPLTWETQLRQPVQRFRPAPPPTGAAALNSAGLLGTQIFDPGVPSTCAWTDLARAVSGPPPAAVSSHTATEFAWPSERRLGIAQEMGAIPMGGAGVGLAGGSSTPQPTPICAGPSSRAGRDGPGYDGRRRALGHRLSSPIREITDDTRSSRQAMSVTAPTRSSPVRSAASRGRSTRCSSGWCIRRPPAPTARRACGHSSPTPALGIWHLEFEPALATGVSTNPDRPVVPSQTRWRRCNPALARMLGQNWRPPATWSRSRWRSTVSPG